MYVSVLCNVIMCLVCDVSCDGVWCACLCVFRWCLIGLCMWLCVVCELLCDVVWLVGAFGCCLCCVAYYDGVWCVV